MIDTKKLVVFDVETTGIDPNVDKIIQLSAIAGDNGETFDVKIKFNYEERMKEALEINSYDPKVWEEEAVDEFDAMVEFAGFLRKHLHLDVISKKGKAYKTAMLCGYNVNFDKDFIIKAFNRNRLYSPFHYLMFDVMQLVLWFEPQLESKKLEFVCNNFSIKAERQHDALSDVKQTLELANTLLEKVKNG